MNWCSHRIQNEVLFPALSQFFLNLYRYKNAKPKGFINDIFYFVKKGTLYNYADDNTLSYGHPDFSVLT
jgi:hypothetical protein